MNYILVTCKNEDCDRQFRILEYKFNSTIKNNPNNQECLICKNKKILAQSTLYDKNKRSSFKTNKYTRKGQSSNKRTKTPRQKAMDLADKWFSLYIRIKYNYKIQDGEVFCQCIINPGIIKLAKNMDNGHCFSRDSKAIRYEEDNCRPQNRSSNRFSGEADHYKFIENLTKQIGKERFERLDNLRKTEIEDNENFYKIQAEKYKKLTNQLVKKYSINKWW